MEKKHHYELTAILKPEGDPESIKQFAERVDAIANDFNGKILSLRSWGEKKLAYEIKKNLKGHYLFFDLIGTGKMIEEIERNFNIWEIVLKFMSIRIDKRENLDELFNSAQGIDSLFEKEEKQPAASPMTSDELAYDEERKEIEETRKYNEELQKSLGNEGEEEEEEIEL